MIQFIYLIFTPCSFKLSFASLFLMMNKSLILASQLYFSLIFQQPGEQLFLEGPSISSGKTVVYFACHIYI